MQSMTVEQLRATVGAGGVTGVTLKGQGGGFFVEIATRSGQDAILVKARTTEPRRFGNPTSALIVLRDVGIDVIQVDATDWNPDQKDMSRSTQNRADAMREAHEAAAYNQWLQPRSKKLLMIPGQASRMTRSWLGWMPVLPATWWQTSNLWRSQGNLTAIFGDPLPKLI